MISDKEKAELDRYYLEHFSFLTDMKILFGTVFKVLKAEDIHQGAVESEEND
jgi:O-antigen biosynthesis protein WbqP